VANVRLGLIGCGLLAERGYAPAIERARGVVLTAVADPVRERCVAVAPGVPAFATAADLVAANAADALVLATPVAAHVADARLAAAAGLPALIEKPPAPTLQDAELLAALAPMPSVGFNRRFEPELRRLRDMTRGLEAVDIELTLHRRRRSWPSHESSDPVALDLGPHLVDLALWLTGAEPAHVHGASSEDELTMEIELADARGRARITCALGRRYRERVAVRGQHGSAAFSRGGIRSAFAARRESPLVSSLALQLEAFAAAVRGDDRDPDLATAVDGVRVMSVLQCVTS
jgi:predicted dehydrogenase